MKRHIARTIIAALCAAPALAVAPSGASAQGIGLEEFRKMKIPTGKRLERGERIYENQCAGCHGSNGKGRESYPKQKFANPIPDLTDQEYRHGGGIIQTYEILSEGIPDGHHPTFNRVLRYQERWAVAHFVRAWGLYGKKPATDEWDEAAAAAADGMPDPPAVRRQARVVAEKGRCAPDVMKQVQKNIGSQLEPKGDEQIQKGKKLYTQTGCQACHGSKGKVNPGMKGLPIPPRNFRTAEAKWQAGPNPLAIFNTLTNGARGQMRAYQNQLKPAERWAIAHFLLEKWVPQKIQTEVGEQQLRDLCRQKSASEPPKPMWTWDRFESKREAVDYAMARMVADQPEEQVVELRRYGPIKLVKGANKAQGRRIFQRQCAQCHGAAGQGRRLGPFGVERVTRASEPLPRLYVDVRKLRSAHAAGTFREFAARASSGVHASLPDMSAASLLDAKNWQDLQAYIASLEGDEEGATIRPEIVEVPASSAGPTAPDAGETGPAKGTDTGAGAAGSGTGTAPAGEPDTGTAPPEQTEPTPPPSANPDAG